MDSHFHAGKMLLGSLIIVIMIAAVPGHVSAVDQPRYGGTFVVAMGDDPGQLNPDITESVYPEEIGICVFNGLLSYDENFTPYPDLAQSWKVSPDGLTYTFNLVKNATWHDGYPLTSADVKFTYTQVLPKYKATMLTPLKYVTSIDTPDNFTIVFNLSSPYTPFFQLLESLYGAILPAHLYAGTDILNNKYNLAPIGSGPFKFVEWRKNEYVKLARNPNYFQATKPYLDQIILKVIPDSNARVLAIQQGDVNLLAGTIVPASAVAQLTKNQNLNYTFKNVFGTTDSDQIQLNLRNPILNKTDVRHALSYGIDRKELVDKILFGLGQEAVGPIPSTYGPATFNPNLPKYDNDVAKANDLLDKAGYPRGADGTRFSLELRYYSTNANMGRAGELIKSQLARIGVTIKLMPGDRTSTIDAVYNQFKFDMFMSSFGTSPLPDIGVAHFFLSSNIGHALYGNAAPYNNPTTDALWNQAATTVDPAKRTQALYSIQEILVRDMPHIWLWEPVSVAFWTKDFAGICSRITNEGADHFQFAYWLKGSAVSPESTLNLIETVQSKLADLQKQGYDVTNAMNLISQAKSAYDSGNYGAAQQLASDALRAAVAPFPWTLAVGSIIAIGIAAGVFLLRRRKQASD